MTQLKYWDGSSWITAVVGAQGPQGATGNSVSLMEGLFASNWGHSFTNGMAPTTAYPPGPSQDTWPYRVGFRMGTLNQAASTGGARIRNGGWPGTNTATDAQLMITGYSTSSLKYTDSYTTEVPSHYIFNPGRGYIDGSTTVSTSGWGATLYKQNPDALGGDPGFLMLQCAVNETLGGGETWTDGSTVPVVSNVQVSSSGTTVTLQPVLVTINASSNQMTVVSGPVPNAGQIVYIAGAGVAGGCLSARVSSVDVSSSVVQLDTNASTSVSSAKCWTQIYQYDSLIIGSTGATMTVPTTPFPATGGTIVFHYGAASQAIPYNSTPTTAAAALTLLIQQQPGLSTADVIVTGPTLASCTFSFYTDAGHGFPLAVGDLWADFTLLTSANGCPGGCTFTLNGTTTYVTSATPTMSAATSSSTFTVTTNTSVTTSGTVGAAQKFGQWYGAPSSVYGSVYTGWRDAWKNSLRTMLRWARADVSTATANGGYYSGINKSGSESGPTATGNTSPLITTTSTIGGISYSGGGNWPSNRAIYFSGTSPFSIGQVVILSTSGGGYQYATVVASGAPSPSVSGVLGAIGIDQAYTGPGGLANPITVNGYSWIPTSSALATLCPQAASTNFAPGPVSPSAPWAAIGTINGTLRNSQNNTASYALQVRDKYSTGEVVVLYPAYPNLQSDDSTANTGGTFTVSAGTSTTVTQVSGYPFSKTRLLVASPVWTMNSALVTAGTVGGNSTVTISKASGGTNIVEFDSVFTTTSTPPWCVLACEYAPPAGTLLYRNRGFNDLQQGYMDVAAEAEFAWYVAVIPPITTLGTADLNPTGASFALHPNNLGQQKWATYIQSWLTANAPTYWAGPLPAGRPYNGSTTGLGSRMGYY